MRYVLFLCLSIFVSTSFADEPLPLPQSYEWCHPNIPKTCAYVDTEMGTSIQYRDEAGKLQRWHVRGWYRHIELANNGKRLVTLYNGAHLLSYNDNKADTVMLELWRAPEQPNTDNHEDPIQGHLVQRITLAELISDMDNLERTVSHWYWGDVQRLYIRSQIEDKGENIILGDLLEIKTVEGRVLYFDMLTGVLEGE